MTDTTPLRETDGLSLPLRLTDLNARVGTRFRLTPTPEARAALASASSGSAS